MECSVFFKNSVVGRIVRTVATLGVFLLAGLIISELVIASGPPNLNSVATRNVEWFFDDVTTDSRTESSQRQSATGPKEPE